MSQFGIYPRSDEASESNPPPVPMVYVSNEPTFEFKQIIRDLAKDSAPDEDELSALGSQGWQIAGIFTHDGTLTMYLQRRK